MTSLCTSTLMTWYAGASAFRRTPQRVPRRKSSGAASSTSFSAGAAMPYPTRIRRRNGVFKALVERFRVAQPADIRHQVQIVRNVRAALLAQHAVEQPFARFQPAMRPARGGVRLARGAVHVLAERPFEQRKVAHAGDLRRDFAHVGEDARDRLAFGGEHAHPVGQVDLQSRRGEGEQQVAQRSATVLLPLRAARRDGASAHPPQERRRLPPPRRAQRQRTAFRLRKPRRRAPRRHRSPRAVQTARRPPRRSRPRSKLLFPPPQANSAFPSANRRADSPRGARHIRLRALFRARNRHAAVTLPARAQPFADLIPHNTCLHTPCFGIRKPLAPATRSSVYEGIARGICLTYAPSAKKRDRAALPHAGAPPSPLRAAPADAAHAAEKQKAGAVTAVPIENFYHSERSIAHYTLRARQCAYLFYFLNFLLYNNIKVNSNLDVFP